MKMGRDALLWQLVELGLVEPDPLGDALAGWSLTDFAQRRLQVLWSINSAPSRYLSGSRSSVDLAR
jgi:hypothetical protein